MATDKSFEFRVRLETPRFEPGEVYKLKQYLVLNGAVARVMHDAGHYILVGGVSQDDLTKFMSDYKGKPFNFEPVPSAVGGEVVVSEPVLLPSAEELLRRLNEAEELVGLYDSELDRVVAEGMASAQAASGRVAALESSLASLRRELGGKRREPHVRIARRRFDDSYGALMAYIASASQTVVDSFKLIGSELPPPLMSLEAMLGKLSSFGVGSVSASSKDELVRLVSTRRRSSDAELASAYDAVHVAEFAEYRRNCSDLEVLKNLSEFMRSRIKDDAEKVARYIDSYEASRSASLAGFKEALLAVSEDVRRESSIIDLGLRLRKDARLGSIPLMVASRKVSGDYVVEVVFPLERRIASALVQQWAGHGLPVPVVSEGDGVLVYSLSLPGSRSLDEAADLASRVNSAVVDGYGRSVLSDLGIPLDIVVSGVVSSRSIVRRQPSAVAEASVVAPVVGAVNVPQASAAPGHHGSRPDYKDAVLAALHGRGYLIRAEILKHMAGSEDSKPSDDSLRTVLEHLVNDELVHRAALKRDFPYYALVGSGVSPAPLDDVTVRRQRVLGLVGDAGKPVEWRYAFDNLQNAAGGSVSFSDESVRNDFRYFVELGVLRVVESGDRNRPGRYEVAKHAFGVKRREQVVSALENLFGRNPGMAFTLNDLLQEALCFSEFPVEAVTVKLALGELRVKYGVRLSTRMGRGATYSLAKE
ncbi:hypothetical protein HYU12_00545 [Candidatus Woesearchaeota archaeon]|nr:hypothetical protein [Candidatus Woesearchaeota archaeon]